MGNRYKLSILLVTYNHANYIREALDKLFGQIIDEQIELVIADDASSDDTLAIIREYEGVDERFAFKYLDNSKNHGITKNYERSFAACSGEYVAVLEGDDYWINPFKLQKQIEFLDMHWECNLCSVNYFVFEEKNAHLYPRTNTSENYRLISARELIADNIVGNFSTCMYRKLKLDELPKELFEIKSYDWITNICIAKNSFIGFLETPMSVYRLHGLGTWTQKSQVDKLQEQLDLIPSYNALTNFKYNDNFIALTQQLENVLDGLKFEKIVTTCSKPIKIVYSKKDYLPPIIVIILKLILPPVAKNILMKIIRKVIK